MLSCNINCVWPNISNSNRGHTHKRSIRSGAMRCVRINSMQKCNM